VSELSELTDSWRFSRPDLHLLIAQHRALSSRSRVPSVQFTTHLIQIKSAWIERAALATEVEGGFGALGERTAVVVGSTPIGLQSWWQGDMQW
jgi:hypothetical protein